MIDKVESNKDKQSIISGKAVAVRINGRTEWKGSVRSRRNLWETTVQVELPGGGLPSVIRFRFCRYPGAMPVGLFIDHDGSAPITLDGRQIKAN
jgi:hypothetical protein